jgi:hypothetical protein
VADRHLAGREAARARVVARRLRAASRREGRRHPTPLTAGHRRLAISVNDACEALDERSSLRRGQPPPRT